MAELPLTVKAVPALAVAMAEALSKVTVPVDSLEMLTPAPPLSLAQQSDTSLRGVGAHRSHLGPSSWHKEVVCGQCHVVPQLVSDPGHLGPLPADMTYTGIATGTVWTSPSCTSYCHGATLDGGTTTEPDWTSVGTFQAICNSCHGLPPNIAPHTSETWDCGQCHPTMEPETLTMILPDRHIDGVLDFRGCTTCHVTAQGSRRQVVGIGGDFERASHHVNSAVEDDDCIVCHDVGDHRSGNVRLRDADSAAVIATLTSDPATSAAEAAKLDAFCLSCHDADGANGSPPFSDGVMPPPIDDMAWAATSHNMNQMSCYGDGESFGCHDNGHGSAKQKLLAPSDASQPPVVGDPLRQEEGMCYSCHTAAGVAASDVEAPFGLASHHPVSAVEQVSGARVECANCHNPHLAKPSAKLIDPDNGALWENVDYTDFCLRCHDGAPPVGVSFSGSGSANGSGFDKSQYVGTTHDLELGAGNGFGCLHCHDQHGTSRISTLEADYATADYTPYSAGAYALCFSCHGANALVFNGNAFEDLHDKHVRGEDAPCIVCHDPHAAADLTEPGLIDFDIADNGSYDFSYFGSASNPSNAFWAQSSTVRNCELRCHGKQHEPKDYDPTKDGPVDTTNPSTCASCHP